MSVTVQASSHPLKPEWVYADVDAGQSIYEIAGGAPVAAYINGREVPEAFHRLTQPKDGSTLILWPVPQDGDILRTVALVAVAVVSGGIAAGTILPGLGTTAALGVSAAVSIGGRMLVNALIPPQQPDQPNTPESFNRLESITGTSNRVAAFKPIPRLYGEFSFFPPIPMTAKPYTEIVGSDQYLRMFLCLGYGPLDIGGQTVGAGYSKITEQDTLTNNPISIGETDINQFENVEYEIGTPDQMTLYSDQIIETNPAWQTGFNNPDELSGDTVSTDTKFEGAVNTSYIKNEDESAVRTTEPNADEISISALARLFSVNDKAKTKSASIVFRLEYREVGTSTWITQEEELIITSSKKETARLGYRWKVPRGQYEVRVTRTQTRHDAKSAISNDATWDALRTIRSVQPFDVEDTVCMALRIKATDQLNGRIEDLSVLATSVLDVYDGTQWVKQATNNPAWVFADIWSGTANRQPVGKSGLDADALKAWADYCDLEGFEYNGVFDSSGTTLDRAQEVAGAGLASWQFTPDSKISVVRDIVQTVPKMVISPRNSFGFNYELSVPQIPDALRVQFIDDFTWENTERLVFDDGFDESNAELYETLQAKGVTNPDQAWKYGRYHIAQQRLRPERYNFNQDVQHLRYTRGDLLTLQHDVIAVGLGAGRIKEVVSDTEIVTDEVFTDNGSTLGVKIQHQDGTVSTVGCTLGQTGNTVILDSAVTKTNLDDLVIFGEKDRESIDVKVTEIQPQGDFQAQVTCVPASPEIEQAWDGTIPPFDPVLTEPVDPDGGDPEEPSINVILSNISSLVYDAEGSPVASIVVNLVLNNSTGNSYKLQLRYRESGQTNWELTDPTAKTNITIPDVSTGVEYEIQARAVRGEKYSPWTPTQTHTVYNTSEVASAIPTIISLSQLDQPLKPINTVQSYIVVDYSIEGVQPPPEVVELKWNVQGSADVDTRTFEVEPETNSYSVRLPIDTYGVTYEVKARAKGINGVWSQYSPASTITTTDPVISVSEALDFLQGEITESQLFQSLNDRIDLIDADAAVEGSVNQRIDQTASELNDDIVAVEQNTTTNASDINGLEAQYTVKIDNNGSVSGFGLASTPNDDTTDGSFSEFYVNADRFAITEPGSTSPYIPFIVQTSSTTNNGEYVPAGVYIEDAFIKNGSVEEAKIGSAAITNAKIQTAAVDTLEIKGNAVTIPSSAYTAGTLSFDALLTWHTIQSVSFTSSGAPINVFATAEYVASVTTEDGNDDHTAVAQVNARLLRDGSVMYSTVIDSESREGREDNRITASTFGHIALAITDIAGAGYHTYTLQIRYGYSFSDFLMGRVEAAKRNVLCLETKR